MKKFLLKLLERILKVLALRVLRKFKPKIIAITGSSGKTSAKELIYQVLKAGGFDVVRSEGNLNNQYGIPLAILGFQKTPSPFLYPLVLVQGAIRTLTFTKYPKILVLEMAADRPGDIEYLAKLTCPELGIITNIGVAHLEFFKTIENIAKEKLSLFNFIKGPAVAVLNSDDKFLKKAYLPKVKRKIFFGKSQDADYQITKFQQRLNGTDFWVRKRGLVPPQSNRGGGGEREEKFSIEALGEHQVFSAVLAVAVGRLFGIDFKILKKTLAPYEGMPGRGKVLLGRRDIVILDESYNANPVSMKQALEVLASMVNGRRVAILGEMRELGWLTKKAHQEIGKLAKESAELTMGVGFSMKDANLDYWFPTVEQTMPFLQEELKSGDIVLVKGSLAVGLKKIVDELK